MNNLILIQLAKIFSHFIKTKKKDLKLKYATLRSQKCNKLNFPKSYNPKKANNILQFLKKKKQPVINWPKKNSLLR